MINGESYDLQQGITVKQLLNQLELDEKKIAVERNLEVVPCSEFAQTTFEEDDQVEIIHFIGGG